MSIKVVLRGLERCNRKAWELDGAKSFILFGTTSHFFSDLVFRYFVTYLVGI